MQDEVSKKKCEESKKKAKRAVAKAKREAYDELYVKLETRKGEKDLHRMAKQKDRAGNDILQVRVIKDVEGKVLTGRDTDALERIF